MKSLRDYFVSKPAGSSSLYDQKKKCPEEAQTSQREETAASVSKIENTDTSCVSEDDKEEAEVQVDCLKDENLKNMNTRKLDRALQDGKKRKYVVSSSSSVDDSSSDSTVECVKSKPAKKTKKSKKDTLKQKQVSPAKNQNSILRFFSGKNQKASCENITCQASLKAKSNPAKAPKHVVAETLEDSVELISFSDEDPQGLSSKLDEIPVKESCSEKVVSEKKKPKWNIRLQFGQMKPKEMDCTISEGEGEETRDIQHCDSTAGEEISKAETPLKSDAVCGDDDKNEKWTLIKNNVDEKKDASLEEDSPMNCDEVEELSPKLRRSSRVRKPVAKFSVESDSDAEPSGKAGRHSGKKKKIRDVSPSVVIDSGDSSNDEVNKKRPKKLAPLFIRPKKHVPTAEELAREAAKLSFLASGVPEEVKQHQEQMERFENVEVQYVPRISHIQQFDSVDVSWITVRSPLPLPHREPNMEVTEPGSRLTYVGSLRPRTRNPLPKISAVALENASWSVVRRLVKEAQKSAPQFPFFHMLYRLTKKYSTDLDLPWVEKYKPLDTPDVLFNRESTNALQAWAKEWKTSARRRKISESSESSDCDEDILCGAVLLSGPSGSGKTTSAYSVAKQVGWDLLEINASSKRSGKHLQLALQEATQSHQMTHGTGGERVCAILVEDVDLVFAEDQDGYYQTLVGLISSSKRPVILTTTSTNTDAVRAELRKRISHIQFERPSTAEAACYVFCVCLIDGCSITVDSCTALANALNCDLRAMLYAAQLWTQPLPSIHLKSSVVDHLSKNRKKQRNQGKIIDNSSESESEETQVSTQTQTVPFDLQSSTMENRDWDYSRFLNLPTCELYKKENRVHKPEGEEGCWWKTLDSDAKPKPEIRSVPKSRPDPIEVKALKDVESYLDCESSLDCVRGFDACRLLNPWWVKKTSDGLTDVRIPFRDSVEPLERSCLVQEVVNCGRTLLESVFRRDNERACKPVPLLGSLDESVKTSYFSQLNAQRSADLSLMAQLELVGSLQRTHVALDYLPCLRAIYKTEVSRLEGNTKRGGRFHHYARSLGLNLGHDDVQSVASSLV